MRVESYPHVVETDELIIETRVTLKKGDVANLIKVKQYITKRQARWLRRLFHLSEEQVKPCGCSGS